MAARSYGLPPAPTVTRVGGCVGEDVLRHTAPTRPRLSVVFDEVLRKLTTGVTNVTALISSLRTETLLPINPSAPPDPSWICTSILHTEDTVTTATLNWSTGVISQADPPRNSTITEHKPESNTGREHNEGEKQVQSHLKEAACNEPIKLQL